MSEPRLCAMHYMRIVRHGDPGVTMTPGPKPTLAKPPRE
jgi:hypothetical protein